MLCIERELGRHHVSSTRGPESSHIMFKVRSRKQVLKNRIEIVLKFTCPQNNFSKPKTEVLTSNPCQNQQPISCGLCLVLAQSCLGVPKAVQQNLLLQYIKPFANLSMSCQTIKWCQLQKHTEFQISTQVKLHRIG